jgi:hypothetical protein
VSREDEQTLGKFEPGDIVDAGEPGRGLAMQYEEAATLRRPSAVHRYCGGSAPASPARVLAKDVRRVSATQANGG